MCTVIIKTEVQGEVTLSSKRQLLNLKMQNKEITAQRKLVNRIKGGVKLPRNCTTEFSQFDAKKCV